MAQKGIHIFLTSVVFISHTISNLSDPSPSSTIYLKIYFFAQSLLLSSLSPSQQNVL